MRGSSTIFDQKIFDIGDVCYCLASSVDKPHFYIKFRCIVRKRQMFPERIVYFCEILNVLENRQVTQQYIHNMRYRFHHAKSRRGHLKQLECFDLFDDFNAFDINFNERFKKHLLIVPNILIASDETALQNILDETISIMKARLYENIRELEDRA